MRATGAIAAVQFGVLSPDDIEGWSVVEVTKETLYKHGIPEQNGLHDLRMGTIDRHRWCETCRGDVHQCPGHPGHIRLNATVYHPGFLPYVLKTLRCVCFACQSLLLGANDAKWKDMPGRAQERILRLASVCVTVATCPACGYAQPKVNMVSQGVGLEWTFTVPEEETPPLTGSKRRHRPKTETYKMVLGASRARQILERIDSTSLARIGFDGDHMHPAWMILTHLMVPPPCIRPSVVMDSTRGEDDLTRKLVDIVRANHELVPSDDGPCDLSWATRWDATQHLQYHVAIYLDNESFGKGYATQRGGHPLKTLKTRMTGKGGRFRANLSGKRVDFSARTIITPDTSLSMDEVGMPQSMAQTLTFPETVNRLNFDRMLEMVERGPATYPGAKNVKKRDGDILDLRFCKDIGKVNLSYGDCVERHLVNGDYVLFNRQPSLHKMSMMAHRVRIQPDPQDLTLSMPLADTSPYNGDFDGDEMNIHVPQTEMARAELSTLMTPSTLIVSAQANKPVIAPIQDELLGASLFTCRDVFLDKSEVDHLITQMASLSFGRTLGPPAILWPKPMWTGKQVYSLLLPDSLHMTAVANMHLTNPSGDDKKQVSPKDTHVLIDKGELLRGRLCRRTIGRASGGIVHIVFNDYGSEAAKLLIDGTAQLINAWMQRVGYSIGVDDIRINEDVRQQTRHVLDEATQSVQKYMTTYGHIRPGDEREGRFEQDVNRILNRARDRAGAKTQRYLPRDNHIRMMVEAGSKGSTINVAQILSAVGQQNVGGKRIPLGYTTRSLPHFLPHDRGAEAQGFIPQSYRDGLTPTAFFFHAMAGREGLIDTAIKTSKTGYLERRMMKAEEDVMVHYDGTVRNALGHVIQRLYGDDGMDGMAVEWQHNLARDLTDAMLVKQYDHGRRARGHYAPLQHEWDRVQWAKGVAQRVAVRFQDKRLVLPIPIARIIHRLRNRDQPVVRGKWVLASQMATLVTTCLETLVGCAGMVPLLEAHLWLHLASKRLLHHIDVRGLEQLLAVVTNTFHHAHITPGEMVGALGAQSLVEPATQMTLNTFHAAGVSSKNVTLGIPRLEELINVSKRTKTPSMTVTVSPDTNVTDIARDMVHVTLAHVVTSVQVLHDPTPQTQTGWSPDQDMLRDYYALLPPNTLWYPWVLRLEMDVQAMLRRHVCLGDVGQRIRQAIVQMPQGGHHPFLVLVGSDRDPKGVFLRIRPKRTKNKRMTALDKDHGERWVRRVRDHLAQHLVTLAGVKDVTETSCRHVEVWAIDETHGGVRTDQTTVIDTVGGHLADMDTWRAHVVDMTQTYSNDLYEMFMRYGIEVGREVLYREVKHVLSFDGSYVNYRHLALLLDVMTYRGYLMPITRFGMNKLSTGPLVRCSFEQTVDQLMQAAAFSNRDHLAGITEEILTGKRCRMGSGAVGVRVDPAHVDALYRETQGMPKRPFPFPSGRTIAKKGTPFLYGAADVVTPLSSLSDNEEVYTASDVSSMEEGEGDEDAYLMSDDSSSDG